MIVLPYKGKNPKIAKECFIAANAALVGDIVIEEASSVWFGVSIRAENGPVRIGRHANIQDNSVLHVDLEGECTVGDNVSIGHGAIVHGAIIGRNSLIGMGAILLNNCKIGKNCVIGAGSLVTQRSEIPEDSLALGNPAVVKRKLTQDEIAGITANAANYDSLRIAYIELSRKSG